jgi:hypothetical protein
MGSSRTARVVVLGFVALAGCDRKSDPDPPPAPARAAPPSASATAVSWPAAISSATSAPAPAPPKPATTTPGDCVDPLADAKTAHAVAGVTPTGREIDDLDGDGVKDRVALFEGSSGSIAWNVYVSRGACGHYLGQVPGLVLEISEDKTNGIHDLLSTVPANAECHVCGCKGEQTRYSYNGHALAKNEEEKVQPVKIDCRRKSLVIAKWRE